MLNKGNSKENRKTTYILGKIFTNHAMDKGFISKIHKQLHNSTSKTNNLIKIWAEDLNRHFSRTHTNGQEAYEKMFNVTVKEIQIKKLECPIISFRSECVCVCVCMCVCVSHSVESDSLQSHWPIFQARILDKVAISFSKGFSWPRDEPGSSTLQADSIPSDPPGKPILVRMAIIKNSTNYKVWRWYREKRGLLNCWQEWKLVQSLWKTVCRKTKNRVTIWSSNPTPGVNTFQLCPVVKTLNSKRYIHPNVHNSTICNSQGMEATQVLINRWLV